MADCGCDEGCYPTHSPIGPLSCSTAGGHISLGVGGYGWGLHIAIGPLLVDGGRGVAGSGCGKGEWVTVIGITVLSLPIASAKCLRIRCAKMQNC